MQYNVVSSKGDFTMIAFLAVVGVSIIAAFTIEVMGIEKHDWR